MTRISPFDTPFVRVVAHCCCNCVFQIRTEAEWCRRDAHGTPTDALETAVAITTWRKGRLWAFIFLPCWDFSLVFLKADGISSDILNQDDTHLKKETCAIFQNKPTSTHKKYSYSFILILLFYLPALNRYTIILN